MCAASRFLTLIHSQDSVESPIAVSGYRWYPAWAFAGYAQGKKHSNDKQNLLCYKQRRGDVLRIVLRKLPFEFCCGNPLIYRNTICGQSKNGEILFELLGTESDGFTDNYVVERNFGHM